MIDLWCLRQRCSSGSNNTAAPGPAALSRTHRLLDFSWKYVYFVDDDDFVDVSGNHTWSLKMCPLFPGTPSFSATAALSLLPGPDERSVQTNPSPLRERRWSGYGLRYTSEAGRRGSPGGWTSASLILKTKTKKISHLPSGGASPVAPWVNQPPVSPPPHSSSVIIPTVYNSFKTHIKSQRKQLKNKCFC